MSAEDPNPLFPRFDGRVAVLTGAASGLSRRVGRSLSQLGAHVVLGDIDEEGLAGAVEEIERSGGMATPVVADVSETGQVEQLFTAAEAIGDVTLLVNAAYVGVHTPPQDLAPEVWRRVLDVTLTGTYLCCRAGGRRMIAAGVGGSIVNFSSIAGSSAIGRGNTAYSTAKAGINQLTRELAVEWGRHGIRVNAVQPCQFVTPGFQAWLDDPDTDSEGLQRRFLSGIPLGRLGQMDDIVGPVVFLLSESAGMITGSMLPVDGGNLAMNAAAGFPG